MSPTNSETVLAVVLDLSASMAEQLGRPDIQTEHMFPFRDGEPNVFPLASEVLRLSKEWLAEEGALPAELHHCDLRWRAPGRDTEVKGSQTKAPDSATAGKPARSHPKVDDHSGRPHGHHGGRPPTAPRAAHASPGTTRCPVACSPSPAFVVPVALHTAARLEEAVAYL